MRFDGGGGFGAVGGETSRMRSVKAVRCPNSFARLVLSGLLLMMRRLAPCLHVRIAAIHFMSPPNRRSSKQDMFR